MGNLWGNMRKSHENTGTSQETIGKSWTDGGLADGWADTGSAVAPRRLGCEAALTEHPRF